MEMLRLVQLPLELQVTPAADSCEAACAWVSLVTASAGELAAMNVVSEATIPSRNTTILLLMRVHHSVRGYGEGLQLPWRILPNPASWKFTNIGNQPQQLWDEYHGLQPPACTKRVCASWMLVV